MTPELDAAVRLAQKTGAPSPTDLARGRERLLAAVARPRARRRGAWRAWIGGSIVVAAAAAVTLLLRRPPEHAAIVADVSSSAAPVLETPPPPAPSLTVATPRAVVSAPTTPVPRIVAPPTVTSAARPARDWKAWVVEGRSDEVVRAARAAGELVLDDANADDLFALGDAARYEGDRPLARSAYAALRRRFPQDARATSAAFFLGRLAESDDPTSAIASYETYLAEAPNGPWSSEAVGRLMLLTRTRDPERSARAARDYLVRQPQGPWAKDARAILGTP